MYCFKCFPLWDESQQTISITKKGRCSSHCSHILLTDQWCLAEAARSNINTVEPSLASGGPTKVKPTEVCCFGCIVWKEFFLALIDTSLILFQAFGEPKVMFSWEDHINKGYVRKRTPASTASWEGASEGGHTRRLLRQNVQHGHHVRLVFTPSIVSKQKYAAKNVLCWIVKKVHIKLMFYLLISYEQTFRTTGNSSFN